SRSQDSTWDVCLNGLRRVAKRYVELRSDQSQSPMVGGQDDGRSRFVQLPARRFVSARETFQEHTFLLELQHAVMAMKPAKCLSHAIQHPFAKPVSLRHLFGARGEFV